MNAKMDPNKLLRATEAMALLGLPRTSFYRNIKKGLIPRQRYMGTTPVWRLGDLIAVFDTLPGSPNPNAKTYLGQN